MKTSYILSELAKKRQKSHSTETLSTSYSILVFYAEGVAVHLCLALNVSHSFLNFEEDVGFHLFFTSYFVLYNSYIKILAIHRYKSS